MRRQGRLYKWLVATIVILALAVAVVLIFQPHLVRAVREGFPATVWPTSGSFATVNGNETELSRDLSGSLTKRLSQLLLQSKAKQILVLYRGKVVIEASFNGARASDRFNSYSLVKGLVGALIFKAVAEGKINSFNNPLQQYVGRLKGTKLGEVALSEFLDMKSGVLFEHSGSKAVSVREPKDLQASFANPFGPMVRLHVLGLNGIIGNLRFDSKGQQKFDYQNVNTALLAAVLEGAYGVGVEKLLEQKIWKPAGAGKAYWRRYGDGNSVSAYCCLYATGRDWAKVGWFLTRNGVGENRFLPEELWRKFFGMGLDEKLLNKGVYANHLRYDILNRKGEALQGPFAYFMGHNGQVVYLMPEQDLVVVRFGDKPQLLHSTLYEIWKSINQN